MLGHIFLETLLSLCALIQALSGGGAVSLSVLVREEAAGLLPGCERPCGEGTLLVRCLPGPGAECRQRVWRRLEEQHQ